MRLNFNIIIMEPAMLQAEKPAANSARNLLLGAFKKAWEKPPLVKKLHAEYVCLKQARK
jgi:hypothetical protein